MSSGTPLTDVFGCDPEYQRQHEEVVGQSAAASALDAAGNGVDGAGDGAHAADDGDMTITFDAEVDLEMENEI